MSEDYYPTGEPPREAPVPAQRVRSVSQEESSTVMKLLSDEPYLKDFTRLLSGWVQVPNAVGDLTYTNTKRPIINERGLIWLVGNITRVMSKSIYLSNYPKERLKSILLVEYENTSVHLATHLYEYELKPQDCEYVMGLFRSAAESSFRRPVGDKERGHIYGSLSETSVSNEQQKGKWFGLIPKW